MCQRDGNSVPFTKVGLDMILKNGIDMLGRGRDIDNVALAKVFGLEIGRQHSIENGELKIGFSPKRCELLARFENVKNLITAVYLDFVDGDQIGCRVPCQ